MSVFVTSYRADGTVLAVREVFHIKECAHPEMIILVDGAGGTFANFKESFDTHSPGWRELPLLPPPPPLAVVGDKVRFSYKRRVLTGTVETVNEYNVRVVVKGKPLGFIVDRGSFEKVEAPSAT